MAIDEDYVRKGAKRVSDKDIQKVVRKATSIEAKVKKVGALRKFLDNVGVMISMVKDYCSGRYRQVPTWIVGAVVFVLLYVLNPFDLIPDFIPIIGYIDDAAVMAVALAMIGKDLDRYRLWKLENPE